MGIDWQIFYDAGRAVLEGMSPYSVSGYFNPPLLAYILAPSTILPFSIWMPFAITVSCFSVMIVARKRSLYLLMSPLFIQAMVWGSVDLLLMASMSLSWGFLVLKPQLLFIALPVVLRRLSRRDCLIAIMMLVAYPPHYVDWLKAVQTTKWTERTSNLASLGTPMMIVGLLLAVIAIARISTPTKAKLVLTALAPVSRIHDYIIAWEALATPKMLLMSWGIFIVWYSLETRNEIIFTLIGVGVFIYEMKRRKRAKSSLSVHQLAQHMFIPKPVYSTRHIDD